MSTFVRAATTLTIPRNEIPVSTDPLSGLVTVYGSPGSGKTVLLRYLARHIRDGGSEASILSAKQDVVDEYSDVAKPDRIAGSEDSEEVAHVLRNVKPGEYLLIDLADYYFENDQALLKRVTTLRKRGANLVLASNVPRKTITKMSRPESVIFLGDRVSRHTLVQGAPWLSKMKAGVENGIGRALVTAPGITTLAEGRVPFIPHPELRNLALPEAQPLL